MPGNALENTFMMHNTLHFGNSTLRWLTVICLEDALQPHPPTEVSMKQQSNRVPPHEDLHASEHTSKVTYKDIAALCFRRLSR